jgi:CubicO group peptidase (beta-lactamase class C family)
MPRPRAAPGDGNRNTVARGAAGVALACGALALGGGMAPLAAAHASDARAASRCIALPEQSDPALATRLDAIVDGAVADGFAGQVAVVRDGNLVFRRAAGHADLESRIPVTHSTLFHVASLTKYFTATAVLRAAEMGLMDIDATAASFAATSALAGWNITVADLLAHRSGLGSTYAAEAQRDAGAAVAAIAGAASPAPVAGQFRYSNDGYDLLAILLERATGRTYEQFLREELFAPACLTHAAFWGEMDVSDPRRVGQPLKPVEIRLHGRNYGMIGSAGLLITAQDLVTWQHRLGSGRVLGPASLGQLLAPRDRVSIGFSSYGAFRIDLPPFGQALSARGYEDWGDNAILNDYPDCGLIVAVVTSRGPAEESGKPPFRDSISQAIEGALAGQTCGGGRNQGFEAPLHSRRTLQPS